MKLLLLEAVAANKKTKFKKEEDRAKPTVSAKTAKKPKPRSKHDDTLENSDIPPNNIPAPEPTTPPAKLPTAEEKLAQLEHEATEAKKNASDARRAAREAEQNGDPDARNLRDSANHLGKIAGVKATALHKLRTHLNRVRKRLKAAEKAITMNSILTDDDKSTTALTAETLTLETIAPPAPPQQGPEAATSVGNISAPFADISHSAVAAQPSVSKPPSQPARITARKISTNSPAAKHAETPLTTVDVTTVKPTRTPAKKRASTPPAKPATHTRASDDLTQQVLAILDGKSTPHDASSAIPTRDTLSASDTDTGFAARLMADRQEAARAEAAAQEAARAAADAEKRGLAQEEAAAREAALEETRQRVVAGFHAKRAAAGAEDAPSPAQQTWEDQEKARLAQRAKDDAAKEAAKARLVAEGILSPQKGRTR